MLPVVSFVLHHHGFDVLIWRRCSACLRVGAIWFPETDQGVRMFKMSGPSRGTELILSGRPVGMDLVRD